MLKGSTEFSKIILACGFTDIRRGVDGLAAIARLHYDLDTTEAGTLFLFCGRKRDRIKGLLWDLTDMCLYISVWLTAFTIGLVTLRKQNSFRRNSSTCS